MPISSIPAAGIVGSLQFKSSSNYVAGSPYLNWDDVNNTLTSLKLTNGNVIINNSNIKGILNSEITTDDSVVTKSYTDNLATSIKWKTHCKLTTTTNITTAWPPGDSNPSVTSLDGITVSDGDRILIKNQSTLTQNGVYIVDNINGWERATDFDSGINIKSYAVFITDGNTEKNFSFVCVPDVTNAVVGTDNINFIKFSKGENLFAGTGLYKTSDSFGINIDNSTLDTVLNTLQVKNLGITASKLAASAVTGDKLATGAVTGDKIVDGSVYGDKILALGILRSKLELGIIDTPQLNTGAVTDDKLASNSVTTDKINSGAVTPDKLASNSVTADKINSGAVTDDKLASNSVTTDKINTGAVTPDKLAPGIPISKLEQSQFTINAGDGLQTGGTASLGNSVTLNVDNTVIRNTGDQTFTSTTNSTSALTGAVIIAGGLGVKKDITVDGTITTGSTIITSGAIGGITQVPGDYYAVNKTYVDSLASGIKWKVSCRLATTVNIVRSGFLIIDNVQTVPNDVILVKEQTTLSENGIYQISNTGVWTRHSDMQTSVNSLNFSTFIREGDTNRLFSFIMKSVPSTVGTSNLSFTPISKMSNISPGTNSGLTQNIDNFFVNVDNSTIEINNNFVRIKNASNLFDKSVNQTVAGKIQISNETNSTSSFTGSLYTSGGIGVTKDMWIDGNIHLTTDNNAQNNSTIKGYGDLIIESDTNDVVIEGVKFNTNGITNVTSIDGLVVPTISTQAASKEYVDSVSVLNNDYTDSVALTTIDYVNSVTGSGISWKTITDVATTANISSFPPSGNVFTIDGVPLTLSMRILVKDQTTNTQNGIWIVNSGTWTRSLDASSGTKATGAAVFVSDGITNGDKGFICTDNNKNFGEIIDFLTFASAPVKLSLPSGQMFVGDPSNTGVATEISGDISVSNTGVVTIQSNTITTGKINSGAVTDDKLASDSVTDVKIQTNAVTADKILAGAVTVDKLGTNAVTSVKILSEAVTVAKLSTDSVSSVKIQAGAVTVDKLATDSVTNSKIVNNTITNSKLQYSSITVTAGDGLQTGGTVALGDSVTLSVGSTLSGNKIFTGSVKSYDSFILRDSGSNTLSIKVPSVLSTYNLVLPVDGGASTKILTTDGNGTTTWEKATSNFIHRQVTSNTTLAYTDDIIGVDTTSGAVTITLPLISQKVKYTIVDEGGMADANNITITSNVLNSIKGQSTLKIEEKYNSYTIYTNGISNIWYII